MNFKRWYPVDEQVDLLMMCGENVPLKIELEDGTRHRVHLYSATRGGNSITFKGVIYGTTPWGESPSIKGLYDQAKAVGAFEVVERPEPAVKEGV